MRNAHNDPHKTFVVLPDGAITATYFGVGVESPFVAYEVHNGEVIPAVKPWAQRSGVQLLEFVYRDDPNPEIAEKGLEVYTRWWNGEFGRGKEAAGLIEGWLPEKVRRLREEHRREDAIKLAAMPAAPTGADASDRTPASAASTRKAAR